MSSPVSAQVEEGRAAARIAEMARAAAQILARAGVEAPRLEAELLLAEAAKITRARLFAATSEVDDRVCARYAALVERRAAREPLAYILGRKEFYSLEFEVGPGVLIPRPETETVVDAALKLAAGHVQCRLLDIGTGCGAIALAVAANAPSVSVVATDISKDALTIARRNAARLALEARVEFVHADCWDVLDGGAALGRFDLVVSNPPYIRDLEIGRLEPEIREFEPRIALAGGGDGLEFYGRIAAGLHSHVIDGGAVILEVGAGQAEAVAAILQATGGGEVTAVDDLCGIPRAIVGLLFSVHTRE